MPKNIIMCHMNLFDLNAVVFSYFAFSNYLNAKNLDRDYFCVTYVDFLSIR